MFAIAVTSPEGRTRYVGEDILWMDHIEDACEFDTEEQALNHINNQWTAANGRKAAGWAVRVELI